uniref:Uncharacterized protein n=1 Tax=Zea mays TaxID=4577 RepID=C0PKV8_MAIZE|nr:unknown [Zea mays]
MLLLLLVLLRRRCRFLVPRVYEAAHPSECNIQRVQAHVGEAHPEPARLRAMARRARRDVELRLPQHPVPQAELAGDGGGLAEQPPHVHPHEQPGVAAEARHARAGQPGDDVVVPRPEALAVGADVGVREPGVREHGGERLLRLRRHEREAGHAARRGDHGVVVRVHDADAEPREAQVLGQAVHDVDALRDAGVAAGLDQLRHADQVRRREDRAGVYLVGDEVDVVAGHEVEHVLEGRPRHGGAQRVGRVGEQDGADARPRCLGLLVRRLERGGRDLEPVGAVAVHRHDVHPRPPPQVSVETRIVRSRDQQRVSRVGQDEREQLVSCRGAGGEHDAVGVKPGLAAPNLLHEVGHRLSEGLEAVVVLEQRVVPEAGDAGAGAAPARGLRVVPEVPLEEVEGHLVLGEAHLNDAAGVGDGVVGVLVVGFPPGEVGRVLAVEAGSGHL